MVTTIVKNIDDQKQIPHREYRCCHQGGKTTFSECKFWIRSHAFRGNGFSDRRPIVNSQSVHLCQRWYSGMVAWFRAIFTSMWRRQPAPVEKPFLYYWRASVGNLLTVWPSSAHPTPDMLRRSPSHHRPPSVTMFIFIGFRRRHAHASDWWCDSINAR